MRARLLAFLPWFQVQPTPVLDTNTTTGDLARGKKQRKRKKKTVHQAAMYAAPIDGPAARAWKEKPAPRKIPVGPTIGKLLANDAEIVEPYEQECGHVDYLAIRSTNMSGWDTCSACYFGQLSTIVPIKKKNLDKHFDNSHRKDGARVRCSVCTAMLLTKHLKWHTKYCHLTLQ